VTSPSERPDARALEELEAVLDQVEEELGQWRRRCLHAEELLAEVKGKKGTLGGPETQHLRQRVVALESENHALRQRITAAREQAELLRTRMRFVEERGTGDAA
jgi:predicted  nucleic acid-binding Zn-ribbon protein